MNERRRPSLSEAESTDVRYQGRAEALTSRRLGLVGRASRGGRHLERRLRPTIRRAKTAPVAVGRRRISTTRLWSSTTRNGVPLFTRGVMLGQLMDRVRRLAAGRDRGTTLHALQKATVDADRTKFCTSLVGRHRRHGPSLPTADVSDSRRAGPGRFRRVRIQTPCWCRTITGRRCASRPQAFHGLAPRMQTWDINNQGPATSSRRSQDSEIRTSDPIFDPRAWIRLTTLGTPTFFSGDT